MVTMSDNELKLVNGSVYWSEYTQRFAPGSGGHHSGVAEKVANWAVAHHPPTHRLIEARAAIQYQLTKSEERIEQLIRELDASKGHNLSLSQQLNEVRQGVDEIVRERDGERSRRIREKEEADTLRGLLDERDDTIRELRRDVDVAKTIRERDVKELGDSKGRNLFLSQRLSDVIRQRDDAERAAHEETVTVSEDHKYLTEEHEALQEKLDTARKELAELPEQLAVRLGEHHANIIRAQMKSLMIPVDEEDE